MTVRDGTLQLHHLGVKCPHDFLPIEFERTPDDEDFVGIWKICVKCNLVRLEPVIYEHQLRKVEK